MTAPGGPSGTFSPPGARESGFPLPPPALIERTGSCDVDGFKEKGRLIAADVLGVLPPEWPKRATRMLDFGCGSGRVLRGLLDLGVGADLWGCDIDAESIRWLDGHLSPPCHVFRCEEQPPLPVPSGYFDVVLALSVFTHITSTWSAWLLEMHRVMEEGGLLVASFLGPPMYETIIGERAAEDRIGMNVLLEGQSWDLGGPMVLHSRWWIQEHWGRAFEIVRLDASGFGSPSDRSVGQGVAVLRKTGPAPGSAALAAVRPDDAREIEALRANIEQLHCESFLFRDSRNAYRDQHERLIAERDAAQRRCPSEPTNPPDPAPPGVLARRVGGRAIGYAKRAAGRARRARSEGTSVGGHP